MEANVRVVSGDFGGPEGTQHARVEVSITSIARKLQLEG
jgi:hypothetical protein